MNQYHSEPQIKGWAIDADPQNEPTYPMKHYTGDDHQRIGYERPEQQSITVEILHSNERPGVTAVFGTSTPPSGLSGRIRRFAFRYSENSYGHWLPLLLADRINVIEGLIDDIRKGYVPNIWAEKGIRADWKYDRMGLVRRVAVTAVVTTLVIAYLRSGRKSRKH